MIEREGGMEVGNTELPIEASVNKSVVSRSLVFPF